MDVTCVSYFGWLLVVFAWFSHVEFARAGEFFHFAYMDSRLPDFRAACFQCLGTSRFQAFIVSTRIRNHVEAAMEV